MKEKDLLEKAVRDAKLLKEAAIQSAKNTLVEALSPAIEEKVSSSLGEDLALEMPMYEVEDEEDALPMPGVDEAKDEDDEDVMEAKDEDEDEVCEAKDEEDEDTMEETVNVTQEDLSAAIAEMLKGEFANLSEADMTKGFGDVTDPNDEEGPGDRGLEDKEKDKVWDEAEAPAAKDWSVKEAKYRKYIAQLQQENAQYKKAVRKLTESVEEVNLFNSKLLHTNRLLQSANLSKAQRVSIIEAVDRAQNLREVELVYKSLSESFKIAGVLKESVKQKPKTGKASRYTPASSTVLKESMERENTLPVADRWSILAGLTK